MAPTLTVPRNADELEDMLGEPSNVAKIAETPDTFKNFILDYAKGQTEKDPGIEAQIREETQRQFAEILKN